MQLVGTTEVMCEEARPHVWLTSMTMPCRPMQLQQQQPLASTTGWHTIQITPKTDLLDDEGVISYAYLKASHEPRGTPQPARHAKELTECVHGSRFGGHLHSTYEKAPCACFIGSTK